MIAKIYSAAVCGIDACRVEVEVDVSAGLPATIIVGLPDEAVKESRERVRNALRNSNLPFPAKRITVNLAPADMRKEGPCFDLPIAVGMMCALGRVNAAVLADTVFIGELALDGRIRPVRGVLPVAVLAREKGLRLIVPARNCAEAAQVEGVEIMAANSLTELLAFFDGEKSLESAVRPTAAEMDGMEEAGHNGGDMSEIRGQYHARRALEVAVSGGHNVLMSGSPGTGKTMLASRVPTILPRMSYEEALETSKIHSVSGLLSRSRSFVRKRPFISPHHSISLPGLVGGGSVPRPGQVSLAHNGVLFLDELPEFKRASLEALRQPLEDRSVRVARVAGAVEFPASFMMIASMNPCPCGYFSDPFRTCRCTPGQIQKYLARISGPLMDRIDIRIDVPSVEASQMLSNRKAESSRDIRVRVEAARKLQTARFAEDGLFCNAQMSERHLARYCALDGQGMELARMAISELGISARAYGRIRKVARTIADLAGCENIAREHLAEAVQYRTEQKVMT